MKILHAAETIKGGVATVITQLITNSSGKADMYCLIPFQQQTELNTASCHKIFFQRKKRGILAFVLFFYNFTKLIWKIRPDIVHLHSSFAGFLGRISLIILYPWRRPKVIYCPHAFSFLISTSVFKKKCYIFIEKLLLIRTSKVICVSKFEKDQAIRHGLPKSKLEVIYNGVSIPDDINGKEKADIENKIQLLYVGRFDYQKGFDIILELANRMNPDRFQLTVVGDFVNDHKYNIDNNLITYVGWLTSQELSNYYRNTHIVIVPSRWEGFAMVPLEAMSYKKAVIAANTTSLPEAVVDGETGYLFDIENIEQLILIVNKIDRNSLREMGINGYQRYLRYFTSDVMTNNTIQLYNQLMIK